MSAAPKTKLGFVIGSDVPALKTESLLSVPKRPPAFTGGAALLSRGFPNIEGFSYSPGGFFAVPNPPNPPKPGFALVPVAYAKFMPVAGLSAGGGGLEPNNEEPVFAPKSEEVGGLLSLLVNRLVVWLF